jgi:hypothetical protein
MNHILPNKPYPQNISSNSSSKSSKDVNAWQKIRFQIGSNFVDIIFKFWEILRNFKFLFSFKLTIVCLWIFLSYLGYNVLFVQNILQNLI